MNYGQIKAKEVQEDFCGLKQQSDWKMQCWGHYLKKVMYYTFLVTFLNAVLYLITHQRRQFVTLLPVQVHDLANSLPSYQLGWDH